MEAASGLVCLGEFHEEFEKEWAISNLFYRLRLVNYLFDKTFLDSDDSMEHDLCCVIIEKAMYDQIEQCIDLEVVFLHHL